ncbi:MAG: AAA family ATPase [Pseudomonadota bacterium]
MNDMTVLPLPRVQVDDADAPSVDIAVLWAGRLRILLCAAFLGVVAGVYSYAIAPPVYRTHATVMLEPQEAQVIDIGSVLPGMGHDEQVLNTQAQVLRSRLLVGRVVDSMGLVNDPEFNAALRTPSVLSVRRLWSLGREALGVSPVPVPVIDEDGHRNGTVNTLIRAIDVTILADSLVFEVSIGTGNPEKSAAIVNELADLYIGDQITAKLAATERATVWLTERVVELKARLEAAEALARSARTTRGLPTAEQLGEIERRLDAQRRRLEALGPQDRRRDAIAQQVQDLTEQVAEAGRSLVQLDQLTRDADATRLLYESFLTRLKETSVQNGVHQPDARLLSPAVAPLFQAYPKPPLNILVGLIAGAGLGALWVLGRAHWGARIKTAEEAERLTGLSVVARIPEFVDKRVKVLDVFSRRPANPFAEAMRTLRSAVQIRDLDAPPKVVMVTSSARAEGKSVTAVLLAQSLATWGKRVLVIECDVRNSVLANRLGLERKQGILSVLAGLAKFEDVVLQPAGRGIEVLTGEATSANAPDVFSTRRFDDLLSGLRARYDYIVLDAPAVLPFAETRAIASRSDLVIYLLRAGVTASHELRQGIKALRGANTPAIDVALTRCRTARRWRLGRDHRAWSPRTST